MKLPAAPSRRAALAAALPLAIESGEIFPYYQPRLAARDRRCVGMEALARWHSPSLGSVPPGEFIPYAQDSELVIPLGQRILALACQDTARWIRTHGCDVRVSVNACAVELADPSFPTVVGAALIEAGLTPGDLELEITEQLTLEGLAPCEENIHSLRSMGVRFALDDFGSGFSALSCLVRLPLDVLKLDRSLLHDLEGNPDVPRLIRGTCALAHSLGLDVVAEGVESESQIERLAELGCDELQGFGIAEPMPAEAFDRFLAEHEEQAKPGPGLPASYIAR